MFFSSTSLKFYLLIYKIFTIFKTILAIYIMKEKTKRIDIAITPKVAQKLNEGSFNKTKLIIKLLQNFLSKKENKFTENT